MSGTPLKAHGIADSNVVVLEEVRKELGAHPKPWWKEPPKGDWLSSMPIWTEFAFRDKTGRYFPRWCVQDFTHLGYHPTGNILLCPTREVNNTKAWVWVDPIEFCNQFEFRGIIEEPDKTDGNSD